MPLAFPFEAHDVLLTEGRGASAPAVDATVLEAKQSDFDEWTEGWVPALTLRSAGAELAFPWKNEIEASKSQNNRLCIALRAGNALQGLASVSHGIEGNPPDVLYIEYIATAPHNQPPPKDAKLGAFEPPRYGMVGTSLIGVCIYVSERCGFQGTLGLHSLAGAESWYEKKLGMRRVRRDATEVGKLWYFHGDAEWVRNRTEGLR